MKRRITGLSTLSFVLLAGAVIAAVIQSGDSTDLAKVDSSKNLRVAYGPSTRPTYVASVGAQACTAVRRLSIEAGASAGQGFKLQSWCVTISPATANAAVTVTVRRTVTTASSAGTQLTAEGTGATAISKMDPADGNFPGIARMDGTAGGAGATLDQMGIVTAELGAGAADPGNTLYCKDYSAGEGKAPTVLNGVTNGISIDYTSPGAGALAACSITARVIVE